MFKIRIETSSRRPQLDARELVAQAADAAVAEMRASLIKGVNPVDGSERPPNSEGRPEGYRTGTLANGIRRGEVRGNEERASATIEPPASRRKWVESRGDVLVANGTIGEAIQSSADDYVSKV